MESNKVKFWVGLDPEQTTLQRYADEGSLGIPQFYLVDVEGLVVSSGFPNKKDLEAQLERYFDPALGRGLAAALDDVVAAYEGGAAGAAWKAAEAFLENDDEAVAADAAFLREKVERYAAWQRERVERALGREKRPEAMGELLVFEVRFAKMVVAKWAADQIEGLKKHEDIRADRFAWGVLEKALAKEAKGVKSKGARRSAIYAYKQVVKRYKKSVAAKVAQERIEALEK